MPGYARICPDMPGRCSVIPGDVWLTRLSGNRITGCERPNAWLQLRRWQPCEARHATARDAPEKRTRFEAAPAASVASPVGRHEENIDIHYRFFLLY